MSHTQNEPITKKEAYDEAIHLLHDRAAACVFASLDEERKALITESTEHGLSDAAYWRACAEYQSATAASLENNHESVFPGAKP